MEFEHYLYVVRCADGTLYTGYATDVGRRVAAHNSGRGAKYTSRRRPVTLVRSERFYSKQRAMSAEAYFKQLSRAEKERILADPTPISESLSQAIPAFCEEPVSEAVARFLSEHRDEGYRDFQARLIPTIPPDAIVGVRIPELRKFAKTLSKRPDIPRFFKALPHVTLEENHLHSFLLATIRDDDDAYAAYEAFLPCLDNWEVCDSLSPRPLMTDPGRARASALSWMESDHAYTVRYGILVLMKGFLGGLFEPGDFDLVAGIDFEGKDAYYVRMMQAWYLAEALARRPEETYAWLAAAGDSVPGELKRACVRKACESRRVGADLKARLKRL